MKLVDCSGGWRLPRESVRPQRKSAVSVNTSIRIMDCSSKQKKYEEEITLFPSILSNFY